MRSSPMGRAEIGRRRIDRGLSSRKTRSVACSTHPAAEPPYSLREFDHGIPHRSRPRTQPQRAVCWYTAQTLRGPARGWKIDLAACHIGVQKSGGDARLVGLGRIMSKRADRQPEHDVRFRASSVHRFDRGSLCSDKSAPLLRTGPWWCESPHSTSKRDARTCNLARWTREFARSTRKSARPIRK